MYGYVRKCDWLGQSYVYMLLGLAIKNTDGRMRCSLYLLIDVIDNHCGGTVLVFIELTLGPTPPKM
jgi:hypothetical protein